MLIKGADKNIVDNEGKKPFEYIKDIDNEEVRKELLEIFVRSFPEF
jgi:hypothetical protein